MCTLIDKFDEHDGKWIPVEHMTACRGTFCESTGPKVSIILDGKEKLLFLVEEFLKLNMLQYFEANNLKV